MRCVRHALTVLGLALLGTARAQAATTYTIVDLGGGPATGLGFAYGYGAAPGLQMGTFGNNRISCGKDCSATVYHAVAWHGAGSTPVDLLPAGYAESYGYAAAGTIAAGVAITNVGGYFGYPHAMVWRGAALQAVDLNPSGAQSSHAYATDGRHVAGSAYTSALHAILWNGARGRSLVDLHPSGYTQSEALAVAGRKQAGYATDSSGKGHAVVWYGTAASVVDLTPAGATNAVAYGVDAQSEAGICTPSGATSAHAFLWHGAKATGIDLQPQAGFVDSTARAVRFGLQVGYGHTTANAEHALLWSGSAKSVVDLQQFLPSTYMQSNAENIDDRGDIVGSAYDDDTVNHIYGWHAVLWIPAS